MTSNSKPAEERSVFLTFYDKWKFLLLSAVFLPLCAFMTYECFVGTTGIALGLRILGLILFPALFLLDIAALITGLHIQKNGTVLFMPDIRFIKVKTDDLKRIALVFSWQENGKYSVSVKLVRKDGRVHSKNYAEMFARSARGYAFGRWLCTVSRSKADAMIEKTAPLSFVAVTVIDRFGKVEYQRKSDGEY